jgi:hypothetical protein
MAGTPAAKTSLAGCEITATFEAVRAGALFVSALQPTGSSSPDQVCGVVYDPGCRPAPTGFRELIVASRRRGLSSRHDPDAEIPENGRPAR